MCSQDEAGGVHQTSFMKVDLEVSVVVVMFWSSFVFVLCCHSCFSYSLLSGTKRSMRMQRNNIMSLIDHVQNVMATTDILIWISTCCQSQIMYHHMLVLVSIRA